MRVKRTNEEKKLLDFIDSMSTEYPNWLLTFFCYDADLKQLELRTDGYKRPKDEINEIIKKLNPKTFDSHFEQNYWTLRMKFEKKENWFD